MPAHNYPRKSSKLKKVRDINPGFAYSTITFCENRAPSPVSVITYRPRKPVSVKERTKGNRFKIYPNPSGSAINVEGEGITDITVQDISGRVVSQQ